MRHLCIIRPNFNFGLRMKFGSIQVKDCQNEINNFSKKVHSVWKHYIRFNLQPLLLINELEHQLKRQRRCAFSYVTHSTVEPEQEYFDQ